MLNAVHSRRKLHVPTAGPQARRIKGTLSFTRVISLLPPLALSHSRGHLVYLIPKK